MTTLLERLRAALAPDYEIDRELASGGMGVVFLGRDVALDRRVAIGGSDDLVGDAFDLLLHLGKLPPHEPLDRVDRIAGIGDSLPFGGLADEAFAALGEGNHGRCRAFAFGIFED